MITIPDTEAGAKVVADDAGPGDTEVVEDGQDVGGDNPQRVGVGALRHVTVAEPAQIWHEQSEPIGQPRGYRLPAQVGLGPAMQQE
jgi:hypothetical protein